MYSIISVKVQNMEVKALRIHVNLTRTKRMIGNDKTYLIVITLVGAGVEMYL